MYRFFLIPLLAALLVLTGCTCTARGNVSMPTKAPSVPTAGSTPVVTMQPAQSAPSVTTAPVVPTEPGASPSATAGN